MATTISARDWSSRDVLIHRVLYARRGQGHRRSRSARRYQVAHRTVKCAASRAAGVRECDNPVVGSKVASSTLKWATLIGALALLFAGCFGERTVTCPVQVNGEAFLCPAGTECAKPGYCGEPRLVEQCRIDETTFKGDFAACTYSSDEESSRPGVCLDGICTGCTNELAGCETEQWSLMTGAGPNLTAVWVAARALAYAGGVGGLLMKYDGRSWTRDATFVHSQHEVVSIWGSGPADVYVITQQGELWHWDGAAWTETRSALPDTTGQLTDIDGTSSTDVYAVSIDGAVVKYDGSRWETLRSAPGPALYGIAAGMPFVAVGFAGTIYLGGATTPPVTSETLQDVAASASLTVAVGDSAEQSTIVQYDGSTWAAGRFADDAPRVDLVTVWVADSGTAYAAGPAGLFELGADQLWRSSALSVSALDGVDDVVLAVGAGGAIWRRVARW
jgi:hypothetical protein